jgi:hypothetical protein
MITTATRTLSDSPAAGTARSSADDPATTSGMTSGAVRAWLRLEGVAAFVVALGLYGSLNGNWWLLVPLLLLPDVSAAGYLLGARTGAAVYNLAHNWAVGLLVLGLGAVLAALPLQLAGAILVAHVGMDRAAGYGLKLPTSFGDTHLGRIGRAR